MQGIQREIDEKLNKIIRNYQLAARTIDCEEEGEVLKSRSTLIKDSSIMASTASNLVQTIEALLSLTAELKQRVVINNQTQMNNQVLAERKKCALSIRSCISTTQDFFDDIRAVKLKLEEALDCL